MSPAEAKIALMQVTGWDEGKAERFAALPPDIQKLELQNYADQDWSDPSTPAGQRLLDIIAALGGIAGVVGNVAGAASGVKGAV